MEILKFHHFQKLKIISKIKFIQIKILRIGQSGFLIKNTATEHFYNIIAISRVKEDFIFRVNGLVNIQARDKFEALEK